MYKEETILQAREFLRAERLDSIRIDLTKSVHQSGADPEPVTTFNAGIFLYEEAEGHFCFYGDPDEVAAVCTKIAEMATRLRNACFAAVAGTEPAP